MAACPIKYQLKIFVFAEKEMSIRSSITSISIVNKPTFIVKLTRISNNFSLGFMGIAFLVLVIVKIPNRRQATKG